MKKLFVLLFFFLTLLFSCTKNGFESPEPQEVWCNIEKLGKCEFISESLCKDTGESYKNRSECESNVSSSSYEDVSSSSSRGVVGSSSSRQVSSSSSRGVVGSSSSRAGSSSSDDEEISSSSEDDDSSSSTGNTSSSSSSVRSSSSVGISSSSSLAVPSLDTLCSLFPYYVAKTKKESVKNLFSSEGCTNVTYSVSSTGNIASITGDSISFANTSASSTERNLTIRANAQCGGTAQSKECTHIPVVIADSYRDAKCNHQDIFPVNLTITNITTVIDYACCEPKSNYTITQCGQANFTLSIDGSVAVTSKDNSANLPNLTPIAEPNAQCTEYGDSPGGTLYRYPKRMLMTVTNTLPTGGFSCNSW